MLKLFPILGSSFSRVSYRLALFSTSEMLNTAEAATDTNITEPPKEKPPFFKTHPLKKIIDPQTSVRYLDSKSYAKAYGDEPVWKHFRRNFKGQYPPMRTRLSCVYAGYLSTHNACPICRDDYLVVGFKNVKLLKQFIDPMSKLILKTSKTGVCRKQQKKLEVAIARARDYGYLEVETPFRWYNYNEYYADDDEDNK